MTSNLLYLKQFGKAWEKYIPEFVKSLPAEKLWTVWDWYMRGDGDGRRGYTTSPRLRDDWQEVAMYMGISCDWVVAKPKKNLPKIKGQTIYPRRSVFQPEAESTRGI